MKTVIAAWEATVAMAAPRTPRGMTATSSRSSATFTSELTHTARKGARLSPTARSAAEYTLYTARKGIPRKMTDRYCVERGSMLGVVSSSPSSGPAKAKPGAAAARKAAPSMRAEGAQYQGELAVAARAVPLRHVYVQAEREAGHDGHEEVDAGHRRAHRAHGQLAEDVADDKSVRPVVKLLQNAAHDKRRGKRDKLPRYLPCRYFLTHFLPPSAPRHQAKRVWSAFPPARMLSRYIGVKKLLELHSSIISASQLIRSGRPAK